MSDKRAPITIQATSAAGFRTQLDAAIDEALRDDLEPREAALIAALADIIERTCVVELASEEWLFGLSG